MKKILLILALILLPTFVHADTLIPNGLVGYWTFDGKDTPGRAIDRSASNNPGYFSGIATSTFYTAGKIGQAIKLDGVNDYANVGDPANGSLDFGTGNFTYMTWVKGTDFSATVYAIGKGINGTGYSLEFVADGSGGGIVRPTISDGTVTVNRQYGTLQPNTWYHVAVVADRSLSTGPTVYVNGVSSTCTANCAINFTTVASVSNSNQLAIGQRGADNPGNYFPGFLDDVRIYNRALSQTEVTQLYNLGKVNFITPPLVSNGLVGWWTMDGKSIVNGVVRDSSGQGNNGNPLSIATSTFYTAGKIGQAGNFDGVDDYITTTHLSQLETGNFSFSVWVKPTTLTTSWIMQQWDAGNGPALYMINGSGNLEWQVGGDDILISNFFTVNTWVHVAVIANGTSLSVYKNGVLVAGPTVKTRANSVTGNFTIGGPNEGSVGYFSGTLDEVRVYNRALSSTEITQLYNNGKNVLLTPSYNTNGIIGWWTMDGKSIVNGVVKDMSGNGHDGNLTNLASSKFYSVGKIGQGGQFNGVSGFIDTGSDFIGTSAGTYAAWVYARSDGENGEGSIIDNRKLILQIGHTAAKTINFTSDGATYAASASGAIVYNKWNHIVATRTSSGTTNIYINGVLSGSADQSSGTPAAGTQNVDIGNTLFDSRTWDGYIDDVRIYNRVLSQTEVTQLYNSGINIVNK